ncbi:hypothetical protein [uncultured Bacteroides sp.]|nr:hypothetical protein [uncultured Bacteroides sp.]
MGKNNNHKRDYSKREEEKAKRLIRNMCIGLIVLAVLIIVGYSLA